MQVTALIHVLCLKTPNVDPEWQIPRPKLAVGPEGPGGAREVAW